MVAHKLAKGYLVWIDCEMTGLDPAIDELVEVSVIITDAQLNQLGEGIDVLIKPSQAALDNMNSFVRQMHTNSGLLEELASDEALSLSEATAKVLAYVKSYVKDPKVGMLAGNSIGTDKMFLAAYMPALVDYLHYRVIDVSTIKELARRWYPNVFAATPEKHGGHRALADIIESLEELRYYREALFPAQDLPREQVECISAKYCSPSEVSE